MKRKAGWLTILVITLAAASFLLPSSHAERTRSAESTERTRERQSTTADGRSSDLLRMSVRRNSLGSWFPSLRAPAFRSTRAFRSSLEDVPPTCSQVVTTGPKKVTFMIQDTGSGLDSIVVNRSQNANTVSDAFTPEITESVTVDSTKVDEAFPMMIDLTITDVDGNVHQCNFSDAVTSAGATIVEESCSPANGAIDPGETVTISLCVQNLDSPSPDEDTEALIGTLQSSGGVTSPSGPQSYGAVVAGGPPVCRNFTFTASGSCGGTVTASLDLVDGDTNHGTVPYVFSLGVDEECCETPVAACMLTCPSNITQSNDAGQCNAVVTYPPPTSTGDCDPIICTPASGSAFPVGTTTVTCSPTVDDPSCTFTVTVIDTQPPSITCPPNQTATGEPDTVGEVVNYPVPGSSDNCAVDTVICTPSSGSSFPAGTTTVTCTATDTSGNTATCSFTVTVNIPPGANDDHYFTFVNQAINVAAPGVLTNDTGFPAPTAVPNGGSTTAGGTYTLNADGSFNYTPPAGFTGNDGFDYTATNTAGSDTAHVKLTVTDPATIALRISEFRENGPGSSGLLPSPLLKSPSDNIVIEVLNPSRDEFIEIYNHTPTDVQVGTTIPSNDGGIGVFASAGNGVTDNVVTLVCRIPDGTIIRAKGYVLCTNRGEGGGYSLNSFGFRGSTTGSSNPSPSISGSGQTAVGDFPIINGTAEHPGAFTSVDIPNDAGLLLANVGTNTVGASSNVPDNGDFGFGATGISPLSFTVYDRIGFAPYGSGAPLQTCQLANTAGCGTSGSARPSLADNYCEGGPTGCLRPVGDASTTNHGATVFYGDSGQYSLLRRQTTLNADGTAPQDTNNNVQDILMVAPKPGINIAFNITNFPTGGTNGLVSVLGAAGPQNRNAPPDLPDPGVLQSRLFDSGRTLNQLPNAERRYVIDNGGSPENAGNMNTTIQANNPLGSFIFRFGFRNVSSETLNQLRFRVDQLAVPCGQASPSPAVAVTGSGNARNLSQTSPNCQGSDTQTAVLKVLNMPTELVERESTPGTAETVRGSLIEDTGNSPGGVELAPNGGGINNSLVRTGTAQGSLTGEYSTVVPADGPYFYMAFRLGVVKGGSFKFIIQPEGLPSPIAASDSELMKHLQSKP